MGPLRHMASLTGLARRRGSWSTVDLTMSRTESTKCEFARRTLHTHTPGFSRVARALVQASPYSADFPCWLQMKSRLWAASVVATSGSGSGSNSGSNSDIDIHGQHVTILRAPFIVLVEPLPCPHKVVSIARAVYCQPCQCCHVALQPRQLVVTTAAVRTEQHPRTCAQHPSLVAPLVCDVKRTHCCFHTNLLALLETLS